MGRSQFEYDHLADQARALAAKGLNTRRIADRLGIPFGSAKELLRRYGISLVAVPRVRESLPQSEVDRLIRCESRLTRVRSGFCPAFGCGLLADLVGGRMPEHRRPGGRCPGSGRTPRDIDREITTTTGATR